MEPEGSNSLASNPAGDGGAFYPQARCDVRGRCAIVRARMRQGMSVAKFLRAGVVALAAAFASGAQAQPVPYAFDWTGFYVGAHTGGALGASNFSDPYGASLYGDKVRTPGYLVGAQAGYNWQAPGSNWVVGIEGDASFLTGEGTGTCYAATGTLTSSNCRARPDFGATLTARLGYATGPAGRTLFYGKGGAAVLHNRLDATTNFGFGVFPITTVRSSPTTWGWTLGAGVEQALSPAWSLKLEYDYLDFGKASFRSPASFSTSTAGFFVTVPSAPASVRQTAQEVKIGLNYRIGADPWAQFGAAARAMPLKAPPKMASGWEVETGARYWYSSGRFQKDLPNTPSLATTLISRLTYDDVTAHAGELFARVDSPWQIFLKGFAGLGRSTGGHMNDEDWGLVTLAPFTAYSNTLSSLTNTNLNYATIDGGFNFLHGPAYKVGAFVGYSHVHEQYSADNCHQIASPTAGICTPAISGVAVITETDNWDSLRLGLSAETWLAPQWKLSADAAYLPYVKFSGVDNHWLRALVIDESGHGQGVQLEAMLSYYITPQFSLGIGGRYWAMWTTTGSDAFNGVPIPRSDTYRYERYGVLVQAAYKFD